MDEMICYSINQKLTSNKEPAPSNLSYIFFVIITAITNESKN